MPDYTLEEQEEIVAGVDEAGRGPWAGPVVAAAVILDAQKIPKGINDSKKLSPQKREKLFDVISESSIVGVSIVKPEDIDRLNILGATKLAMRSAVSNLSKTPKLVLVDGNQSPGLNIKTQTVIKGDSKSFSIAAASIIAKVTRDRLMKKLHEEFPEYSFNRNMGYGTSDHINAIEKFGVCSHHRKSFAPVREALAKGLIYNKNKQLALI